MQKRDLYQNQFSNKKGAIAKPESPKKHPIWAAHPRTHLSTKYPPPPRGAKTPNEHHWPSTGSTHFSTCTTLWRYNFGLFWRDCWDKMFKLTANVLFMAIFYMIMLNCIFVLWVGLYGQWKKFTMHPLITYKIAIFRDAKTWTLFFNSPSAFIYH